MVGRGTTRILGGLNSDKKIRPSSRKTAATRSKTLTFAWGGVENGENGKRFYRKKGLKIEKNLLQAFLRESGLPLRSTVVAEKKGDTKKCQPKAERGRRLKKEKRIS